MSATEGIDQNGVVLNEANSGDFVPESTSSNPSSSLNDTKSTIDDTSLVSDTDISMNLEPEIQSFPASEVGENQEGTDKINKLTCEAEDGFDKSGQEDASNQSRELKSLLALSKEARLDTNLQRKRKAVNLRKKLRSENRNSGAKAGKIQYPVTAESELEMELQNVENNKMEVQDEEASSVGSNVKSLKRKKSSLPDVLAENVEEEVAKKSRKALSDDVPVFKENKDMFCWRCHKEGVNIACETCPRSYHQRCLRQTISNPDNWPCPECVLILKAESTQSRSSAMKGMTLEHLCSLLKFAVNRMIQCQGSEPFIHAVNDADFPEYKRYIIQPMDLTLLEKNIKENLYGSTQAFEADAKWILHNSIIFNSYQSKLTSVARSIIKICKQEMAEIENCPSCYLNANTKKKTWFIEVCPKPHLLVWAKLRGFPFWPGKAMSCRDGMVDVRFFGAHDRAWVPEKECFLYSPKDPNLFRVKRNDIEKCVEELEVHVKNLKKIYGEFNYPPFKTPIDPENEVKQLQLFLPKYKSNFNKHKSMKRISERTEPKDIEEETANNKPKDSFQDRNKENDSSLSLSLEDETMEGYGTDDESIPEIDTELRKNLLKKANNDNDNPEADEDDTQMPTNIEPDESGFEEILLSSGTIKNFPTDSKPLKKPGSEPCSKRASFDETPSHTIKNIRRNSETKTESTRISRINISDDMEISLGKADKGIVSHIKTTASSSGSDCSSDFNVEIKKKPVQVDVDNVEFTISPASKLKISDKLIKRLSDGESGEGDSSNENNKIDQAKRNLDTIVSDTDTPKKAEEVAVSLKSQDVGHETVHSDGKLEESVSESVETTTEQKAITESTDIDANKDVTNHIKETGLESTTKDSEQNDAETKSKNEKSPKKRKSSSDSPRKPEISKPLAEEKTDTNKKVNESEVEKSKPKDFNKRPLRYMIQEKASPEKEASSKPVDDVVRDKSDTRHESDEVAAENVNKMDKDASSSEKDSQEDVEGAKNGQEAMETGDIDKLKILNKADIVNIIHSVDTTPKKDDESESSGETTVVKKTKTRSNKRKKSFALDQSALETQNKILKLVSVEVIMNKDLKENEESAGSPILKKTLEPKKAQPEPKKISQSSQKSSSDSARSSIHELSPDEIKSEPESESESGGVRDFAAKKKYLSALNILEKAEADVQKPKSNEIRTRSKTEEKREKLRVSNDSQTIDNSAKATTDDTVGSNVANDNEPSVATLKKKPTPPPAPTTEIFVKSFAKLDTTENHVRNVPTPPSKQRARKSFPHPNYSKAVNKSNQQIVLQNIGSPVTSSPVAASSPEIPKLTPRNPIATSSPVTTAVATVTPTQISKPDAVPPLTPLETIRPANGYLILQQSQQDNLVFLPPNQTITYSAASVSGQMMSMTPCLVSAPTSSQTIRQIWQPTHQPATNVNLSESQNYIPQGEPPVAGILNVSGSIPRTAPSANSNKKVVNGVPELTVISTTTVESTNSTSTTQTNASTPPTDITTTSTVPLETVTPSVEPVLIADSGDDEELTILNSVIPENVSKAVSEIIRRPPPKLKPRPPGALSQQFSEGIPSVAGPATAKINSVAHRLGDYFRGMLIETLDDLGKTNNAEATITSLKQEIETLKHKHSIEITEIEKNMSTVLKDIQQSIIEDRERVVEETRAACEAETIKRVEEAKSKQWCANCSKEAQFYCCWNTSYCDYPCQQKHWPQHMNKCTQNMNQSAQIGQSPTMRPTGSQQLILRPANPPAKGTGLGRVFTKPLQKVYMNRNMAAPKSMRVQTSAGQLLTMMETTPGNYQLVTSTNTALVRTVNSLTNLRPSNMASVSTSFGNTAITAPKAVTAPKPPLRILPVTTVLEEDSD